MADITAPSTTVKMPEWRRTLWARAHANFYPRVMRRNGRSYAILGHTIDSVDDCVKSMNEICDKKLFRRFTVDEGHAIFGVELWEHLNGKS